MQQVGVDREWRFAPFVLRDRDLMLFGKVDERLARPQVPLPPRRDHGDVRLESVIGKLETHLVVALAGGAVRHRVGADLLCDLDLLFGDQRPRDRRPEQILALVERVRAEHRKDVVAHEFFAQILDKDVLRLDAEKQRLFARGRELFALAKIGGEGNDLAAVGGLQPLQDDGGVEPAGIGEHHFLDITPVGVALRHPALQPFSTGMSAEVGIQCQPRFG